MDESFLSDTTHSTERQCRQCRSVMNADAIACGACGFQCDHVFSDLATERSLQENKRLEVHGEAKGRTVQTLIAQTSPNIVEVYREPERTGGETSSNNISVKLSPLENIAEIDCQTLAPPGWVSLRRGKRPAVLLGTASAGGTIAAARHLGLNGIEVSVMASPLLSVAAWSKRVTRTYSAPPESHINRFLDRVLSIGASNPGQILLPTSDETAWLYTVNAGMLSEHFCMYQPSVETMRRILDKKLFADALRNAGLPVLPSWEPRTFDEVVSLSPNLPYPLLIKPRTHVHRLVNDKGTVAHSKVELLDKYARFLTKEQVRAADNPLLPDAGLPILQQFVNVEKDGVCSITGFVDRSGELFVTRRSIKVLQRSQPVGVGVCFESLPDLPVLSTAVRKLCRELQYFGMFEVEFLRFDQGWAAIDFNARLFNQIGMDIRRGMPLPLFACLDALGNTSLLRETVADSQSIEDIPSVFCDRFTLRAILAARSMTGRISSRERSYWRNWAKRNASNWVDFVADDDDPLPGVIHALSEVYLGLKAFPKFLRSMPRVSSVTAPLSAKA